MFVVRKIDCTCLYIQGTKLTFSGATWHLWILSFTVVANSHKLVARFFLLCFQAWLKPVNAKLVFDPLCYSLFWTTFFLNKPPCLSAPPFVSTSTIRYQYVYTPKAYVAVFDKSIPFESNALKRFQSIKHYWQNLNVRLRVAIYWGHKRISGRCFFPAKRSDNRKYVFVRRL